MKRMKEKGKKQNVHWRIGNFSSQKRFIILFSILCFITSCNNEYIETFAYPDEDISNKATTMFIQALTNDDFSQKKFFSDIKPYDIFWNEVEISQSTTYGLCYTIPYGNKENKRVIGAVYYPVDYIGVNKDNSIEFNNTLKTPRFVDADVMNNEIKMNEGFIYSDYFYSLKNKGLTPDEGLLKYMYLLRNPQKLEPSISNLRKNASTRAYVPGGFILHIVVEANFTNNPNDSGIIYGVSQGTLDRIVNQLAHEYARHNHCQIEVAQFLAHQYDHIIIDLSSDNSLVTMDSFVREFIYNFGARITHLGVTPRIQYEYSVEYPSAGGGDDNGGSNTAGESDTGGGSPGSNNNNNQSSDATSQECESMNTVNTKLLAGSIVTFLQEAKKGNYSQTELFNWSEYSATINNSPTNEHSINIENLPNGVGLGHVASGGSNSAERSVYSTTIGCMHNHPNETPPSPKDLLNFVQTCMDPYYEHYKSEIIYCPKSGSLYTITINDRSNLNDLCDRLTNDVDSVTNDFKNGSECARFIKQSYSKKKYGKTDYLINHLQLIADKYASGSISFLKVDIEIENDTIKAKDYTNFGNRIKPNKKGKYEPIKCK